MLQKGRIAELGKPQLRIDGQAKVTGQADYPGDAHFANEAYAVLVRSPMARGYVTLIDAAGALRMRGVLCVLSHENTSDAIQHVDHTLLGGWANSTLRPLASREIHYAGQIVAVVVAETLEDAEAAAESMSVEYEAWPHAATLDAPGVTLEELSKVRKGYRDPRKGDAAQAMKTAEVRVEATYSTPIEHHNPIELPTTTCVWDDDRLTVYEPSRFIGAVQFGLATQLGMDPDKIRVVSHFLGGHFGSKLALSQHTALIAIAAKRLGRPVRLATSRADSFTVANHRPETEHRIRLGALRSGKLVAISHVAKTVTSGFDTFDMEGTDVTCSLYDCANIDSKELLARVDRNTPGPMRAPPEMPFLFAFESAMDELAHELAIDPIELRRRNDTDRDPVTGESFTSRPLMRCFDEAAKAFGWDARQQAPRSVKKGDWWAGYGCAASARTYKIAAAVVRVTLTPEGGALVQTAHHEIGTGLYTLVAMVASATLQIPLERVRVELGDTLLPPSPLSGGSSSTATLANAVIQACRQLGGERRSVEYEFLPEGMGDRDLDKLRHGRFGLASRKGKTAWTFGAQFAEVWVHCRTGEIRVQRQVGAFAAGRIVNPLTAHSQLVSGMIWGLGAALMERTEVDSRTGAYVNESLSEYLVAVNADVGEVIALMLDDPDPEVNGAGIKGLGESGIIGANAAIANAIFNATGRRVRDLPIRLDTMLEEGWL